MVTATVNSYQYSSTEASEKQMLTDVFDLKNKEFHREKYNPSGFLSGSKRIAILLSLSMCQYIHVTFKIVSTYRVYVATQKSH